MTPNARFYNPDPAYLRDLVRLADRSQEKCAEAIGVSPRQLRYYLSTASDHQDAPYCVQFALERLAAGIGARAQDEAREARRMVGAILKTCGGEVQIPRGVLEQLGMDEAIERWDDPASGAVLLRITGPARVKAASGS